MRIILALAVLAAGISVAAAQYVNGGYGTGSNPNGHYVQPHVNSNGTYTSGHYQSNPNNTQYDNYGTRGNVNPYTGQVGTHSPRY
jgi:hypothetical protein